MAPQGIHERRVAAGVSQGLLSHESGVNRQRLSYAECGYLVLGEEETRALEAALRRIVERKMARYGEVLQAV
jgi:hypothetical protein